MALIIDTGPPLAAIDRSDPDHEPCERLIRDCREPLIVPGVRLSERRSSSRADADELTFLRAEVPLAGRR